MKYYIVQRIGFAYNDEVYTESEGGGGTPEKVFKNKTDAEALADKKNAEELSNCRLCEYGYGFSDTCRDGFLKIYNSLFRTELDETAIEDYDFTLPKLNLTQYRRLKPYLRVNFFEVCECEGE